MKKIIVSIIIVGISVGGVVFFFSHMGRRYYKIKFVEAPNLKKGTIVTFRRIKVGEVSNIKITDELVEATFWVKGVTLKEGVIGVLEFVDIFGNTNIDIIQGKGKELREFSTIEGRSKKGIPGVISSLEEWVKHLDSLTTQSIKIISLGGELAAKTTTYLHTAITNIEREIISAVQNAKNIAVSTHKRADEGIKDFIDVVKNLKILSHNLKNLIETTDTTLILTLTTLSQLLEKMDSTFYYLTQQKGSLSKLIFSDSFYLKLDSTLTKLNTLIQDIKENPKKYFSVF